MGINIGISNPAGPSTCHGGRGACEDARWLRMGINIGRAEERPLARSACATIFHGLRNRVLFFRIQHLRRSSHHPARRTPPLPAGLAHTLNDKLNGLDGALAAPPVPLMAEPTVSSSSWLEQQELASVLENQLTGVEAIEVSKTL